MKKETIKQAVAPYMAELTQMADRIYDLAEPGLEEVRSSAILTDYLEKKGFQIERGIAGLPTAMNREKEDLPLDSWQSTTH
jgi:aminobenzoyl-glutamate utilization protein B